MKAGDIVRIIGAADGNHTQWDRTPGFDSEWCDGMTLMVGGSMPVKGIDRHGVFLEDGWYFPAQALEIISEQGAWKVLTEDECLLTRTVMATYGGEFVSKLAMAMQAADSENLAKLQAAFPNLPKTYGPGTHPWNALFGDTK